MLKLFLLLKLLVLKIQGVASYALYLPLLFLLPVILRQGKSVKANTLRLPEAQGVRHDTQSMATRSLLHVGESTVAGVGIDDIKQGLTANIARALKDDCAWQAFGHNGATMADINHRLEYFNVECAADTILITMGVNDTTALTSVASWQQELSACACQVLAITKSPAELYFTQVPPMHLFPALPFPLNYFLGLRAWQLDNALQQVCVAEGWTHLKIDMPLKQKWMAVDGYHPNTIGYQKWAAAVAEHLNRPLLSAGNKNK